MNIKWLTRLRTKPMPDANLEMEAIGIITRYIETQVAPAPPEIKEEFIRLMTTGFCAGVRYSEERFGYGIGKVESSN